MGSPIRDCGESLKCDEWRIDYLAKTVAKASENIQFISNNY